MSGFDLSEYVDVAERIRLFYEKYPDGRIQTIRHSIYTIGERIFVFCEARAFRDPEDKHPCAGTAWEPVPGATPYTRDSELMNAETAAWGRAIIAAGIPSKKIASAEEVRNRASSESPNVNEHQTSGNHGGSGEAPAYRNGKTKPELLARLSDLLVVLNKQKENSGVEWAREFSKEHFQTTKSQDLTKPQLETIVAEAEKKVAHLEAEDVPFG